MCVCVCVCVCVSVSVHETRLGREEGQRKRLRMIGVLFIVSTAEGSTEQEGECPEVSAPNGGKSQPQEKSSDESSKVEVQKVEESDIELEEPMELESGRGLPTGGYWSHYQLLCQQLPGREKQIEFLLTLLGKVSHLTS